MKKEFVLILIVILLIGCAPLVEKEIIGPNNCRGFQECGAYCEVNQQECGEWCELNPDENFCLDEGAPFGALFGKRPEIEKPPADLSPEERKEWIAEQTYETLYAKKIIDIGYEEPSQEDIERIKQEIDLTRKYPQKIHSLFEIGRNTVPLFHFSDELKDLGVNTYVVQAEVDMKDGKLGLFQPGYTTTDLLSQEEAKRVIIHRMLMAKREGFAVSFVPDLPELFDLGKENYPIDELEPQFIDLALEWAKIAEEYQLEYFAPINEYEKLLESNGYDLEFIHQRTNAFYEKLIPQLREVYSGKIIIKTGELGDWENHRGLNFKDADLFGVGVFYAQSAGEISNGIESMVRVMDEISERDSTPWLITEYYIATPEEVDLFFGSEAVKLPMGDAYEAGLTHFKNSKNAVGFTFTGYLGGGRIRGTGAVPVLKEYFAEE